MKNRRYITGHRIIPMNGTLPEKSVLVFDENKLINIIPESELDPILIERFNGTLVPGFVNAHCHLELSYMKGRIPSGTGLTSFLQAVVTQEPVEEDVILDAIQKADQEMRSNGVVAVGDISNLTSTIITKKVSSIYYYNFVEMFDFMDSEKAGHFYGHYESVYQKFLANGLSRTVQVPHSTYTVSDRLMQILGDNLPDDVTGSIHMLENEQENSWLLGGKSEYAAFFEGLGYKMENFAPPNLSSIEVFKVSGYQPERMLFIHNTVANDVDLKSMKEYQNSFLVTCPNANLYIESRLPDYSLWMQSGIPICVGTDSYASNHQLSVWEEVCQIKSRFDDISLDDILKWATIHGARALGMDKELGSFEPGKSPGVVLLDHGPEKTISVDSKSQRII